MNDTQANPKILLRLNDENATRSLGTKLAAALGPGLSVYLSGELGSGKTALVRAIFAALGFAGKVKSPTYTIVEPYEIAHQDYYHFDFYRFTSKMEWEDAGLREYFGGRNICLVEWPEKAGDAIPPADWHIRLGVIDAAAREIEIVATSKLGRECLQHAAL